MTYEIWTAGPDGNPRKVDEHHSDYPPDEGDWVAYSDGGVEKEARVSEVRYVRQRDGDTLIKVFV